MQIVGPGLETSDFRLTHCEHLDNVIMIIITFHQTLLPPISLQLCSTKKLSELTPAVANSIAEVFPKHQKLGKVLCLEWKLDKLWDNYDEC